MNGIYKYIMNIFWIKDFPSAMNVNMCSVVSIIFIDPKIFKLIFW